MSVWRPHGISLETLVETCKTNVFVKMSFVESHSWNELVKQSEQADSILQRLEDKGQSREMLWINLLVSLHKQREKL